MTFENLIFSTEQFKTIDSSPTNRGVSSKELMRNAAEALFARLEKLDKLHGEITIICGTGNNGGDGYALACLLTEAGIKNNVLAVAEPKSDDSRFYLKKYNSLSGSVLCADENSFDRLIKKSATIVDCIFGFSFHGKAKGIYLSLIEAINQSNAFVLSADLPSGLTADSDEVNGACVKADATSTFTAHKIATVSYPAFAYCGKVFVEDIGILSDDLKGQLPLGKVSDKSVLSLIPPRRTDSHKGTYGTVGAVVGSKAMSGAAYLATLAALKSGVGLVKVLSEEETAKLLRLKLAEPLIFSVNDSESQNALFEQNNSAYLLGCGCGRSYDSFFEKLLPKLNKTTVIDADGINFLANRIEILQSITAELIITPHPGEMARLIGKTAAQVNRSRVATAKSFSKAFGTVTLLKGSRTVVTAPDGRLFVNTSGCSALSKGGSGDVLAGLIASLVAQGLPAFESACLGAYLHGLAAEKNEKLYGAYASLPSELPQTIGEIMRIGDKFD